jgi:hypothetical protein
VRCGAEESRRAVREPSESRYLAAKGNPVTALPNGSPTRLSNGSLTPTALPQGRWTAAHWAPHRTAAAPSPLLVRRDVIR